VQALLTLRLLTTSAANSRMLELRGPMMVKGEFAAQFNAAAQAAGHGSEDLAVVVTALDAAARRRPQA